MADWVERQINKKLCEQFPYLVPRNKKKKKTPAVLESKDIREE